MLVSILDGLPSIPFIERSALPEVSGIYYVASGQTIVYIGQSQNLRVRWGAHSKAALMDNSHRIYWREVPINDLVAVEGQEIDRYNPLWNGKMQLEEDIKSVKIPFSAWQALTRLCAATGEPRTRQLAKIIHEAEKQHERSGERTTAPQE